MITRWLHMLSQFDFIIEYRPGRRHLNADALSRRPGLTENSVDEYLDEVVGGIGTSEDFCTNWMIAPEVICQLDEGSKRTDNPSIFWSPAYLRSHQRDDADMSFLFSLLRTSQSSTTIDQSWYRQLSQKSKIYAGIRASLAIDSSGLLRYTLPSRASSIGQARNVLLLPEKLVKPAIMRAHKQVAHMGPMTTFNKIKMFAFFPNMFATIKRVLLTCGPCQTKTTRLPDQRHTLFAHSPGYPFQRLSIDFVGPFPPSHPNRFQYLLTIKDTFTRWIEAFPMKNATAANVIKILQNEIFARYGKCETIHSDRGTQFTGKMLQDMGAALNIKITQTPAYNPKSNAVERMHRDLKSALQALTSQQPSKWVDFLPAILFAFRSAVSSSTGFSPFQLMFGRNPIEELDAILPTPSHALQLLTAPDYLQSLTTRLHQAYALARDNMGLAISRQRSNYHRLKKSFALFDKVWLFTPILPDRKLPKFATGWSGPWTIVECINDLTYRIQFFVHGSATRTEVVSIDRLRAYFADESNLIFPPPPGDLSMSGDEFCEYLPGFNSSSMGSGPLDVLAPSRPSPSSRNSPPPSSSPPSSPPDPNSGGSSGRSSPRLFTGTTPKVPRSPPRTSTPAHSREDTVFHPDDNFDLTPRSSTPASPAADSSPVLPWNFQPSITNWNLDHSVFDSTADLPFSPLPQASSTLNQTPSTLHRSSSSSAPQDATGSPAMAFQNTSPYLRYAPSREVQANRRDRAERRYGHARALTPPGLGGRRELPPAPSSSSATCDNPDPASETQDQTNIVPDISEEHADAPPL